MQDNEPVLITITLIVAIASWLCVSYKSGFVGYSIQSALNNSRQKYTVDKSKVSTYAACVAVTVIASLLVATPLTSEIDTMVLFILVNTASVGYALAFWVLLKEKKSKTKAGS